jgi:hypothetical protein
MTIRSTILAALLVVQLVVAGGLLYASHSKKVTRPDGVLLEFDTATVDRIEIADGVDDSSVRLTKNGDDWLLPDNSNVPANTEKMQNLVSAMADLQTGWAVATKPASHAQLEVAEDDHQRRVKLYNGDELVGDLYVGTSPGMRRVHARKADADEVYSVALNSYDMPAASADWLQKDLLAATDITALGIGNATLAKQEDAWQLSAGDGEPVAADDGKVNALTGALSRLRVQDVAAELPAEATPVSISVTSADGELAYQLVEAGEDYYITRADIDAVFTIQKSDYESIANVSVDDLKVEVVEEDPPAEDSANTAESGSSESSTAAPASSTETETQVKE